MNIVCATTIVTTLPYSVDVRFFSIIDVPVEHTPGKVEFWPKDGADVWGPESVVSDYWAIIAQEEQVREGHFDHTCRVRSHNFVFSFC